MALTQVFQKLINNTIKEVSEYSVFICSCVFFISYVTLEHKTSHEAQFYEIEIYTSSEI